MLNRREFLQSSAQSVIAAGLTPLAATKPTETPKNMKRKDASPRYWAWTGPHDKDRSESIRDKYRAWKSHGLTGVFLENGIHERDFDAIREAGLELHSWMWTTNRGDDWIRKNHPDWYQVSRSGKSCFDQPPYVDYYRWISPVIPGVQQYLTERVEELAAHPLVEGVHLDYVRYPDVILPRALWEHYHLDQTDELPDYDFCYSPHTRAAFKKQTGRDPLEIAHPDTDQEWLHFRYDSVTKLVKKLAHAAHGHGKEITAAVFPTPSQARKICRQDWDKWPLDAACPMIYHSFYNQPIEWIGDCVRENIQAAPFPIYAGLYVSAFSTPDEFAQALRLVRHRGGAGVSLFGDVKPEYWQAFEREHW